MPDKHTSPEIKKRWHILDRDYLNWYEGLLYGGLDGEKNAKKKALLKKKKFLVH